MTSLMGKKIWVHLFFMFIPYIKFQDSISNRSRRMQSLMDGQTDRPKPIGPLNFFEVGGGGGGGDKCIIFFLCILND